MRRSRRTQKGRSRNARNGDQSFPTTEMYESVSPKIESAYLGSDVLLTIQALVWSETIGEMILAGPFGPVSVVGWYVDAPGLTTPTPIREVESINPDFGSIEVSCPNSGIDLSQNCYLVIPPWQEGTRLLQGNFILGGRFLLEYFP